MIGVKITRCCYLPMMNIIIIEQLNNIGARKWLQSHRPASQLRHTKAQQAQFWVLIIFNRRSEQKLLFKITGRTKSLPGKIQAHNCTSKLLA